MKTYSIIDTDERKHTQLDFQFHLSIHVRHEYLATGDGHIYSEWGGVEFDNSWKGGIKRAKEIVHKNPEYLCVLTDRMNRKKPLEF